MTRIPIEQAASKTLKDIVELARSSDETLIVTGPDGDLVRIVPIRSAAGGSTARTWRGLKVLEAAEMMRMEPEELEAAGWIYPDESAWMDELLTESDGTRPS